MNPVRRRSLSWLLIGLPVFLLLAVLIVIFQAKAFLKSDRFRTFLGDKVSHSIRAQGAFRPLQWTGSSFYTDGYRAIGDNGSAFDTIEAEQLRASVNLQGLWNRKWQVESVEIERLTLIPTDKKRPLTPVAPVQVAPQPAPTPKNTAPKTPDFFASFLPNQVDLQHVSVADLRLDGKNLRTPFNLSGLKVEAKPDGQAWVLDASGGSLQLPKQPLIGVQTLALRYVDQTLFVSQGHFSVEGGGTADLTGKLSENNNTPSDLNLKLDRVPAATVLPKDWRAQLHGQLTADLHATTQGKDWTFSGPVTLTDGRLEALPVLDQVALFTRTQRFRQLNLEKATAHVVIQNGKTTVTDLDLDAPGLVRMTGGFVIENGELLGDFLVGVTPASLRYIPGSQTQIFTDSRDGYLWTSMKVSGPLKHLKEDLSARLAVAAGQDLIDTLQKDPTKLKDTLENAAQSLLDLFGK